MSTQSGKVRIAKLKRLRRLCGEMIARIQEEKDPCRFGDIEPIIDETETIAKSLDFSLGPVSRMWSENKPPIYDETTGIPKNDFLLLYWFSDPMDGGPLSAFPIDGYCKNGRPSSPNLKNPWAIQDKSENKETAIVMLGRWQRNIDGLIENETPVAAQYNLNVTEDNIIEAIGSKTIRGEAIAKVAGYPFNSNFKSTLSSLKKRGILDNQGNGYFVVGLSGQGQD